MTRGLCLGGSLGRAVIAAEKKATIKMFVIKANLSFA